MASYPSATWFIQVVPRFLHYQTRHEGASWNDQQTPTEESALFSQSGYLSNSLSIELMSFSDIFEE